MAATPSPQMAKWVYFQSVLQDDDPVLVEGGASYVGMAWYTVPSSSLTDVMAQPQTPFQEFTGRQADAYALLLTKLQITTPSAGPGYQYTPAICSTAQDSRYRPCSAAGQVGLVQT
ncbi:hypothetical protein EDD29_3147 [Actinocorallia herbida]|uniref:Uncharacterized protein n=1 Tax=Actinocorallia herbida TaxID=58109 RepID=A0A3N1CWD9_9ACTN|nr:hypothetical protein [Actinocorallia herbida]ROO85601.1 hypothetical protein EDD29_3147 [Actinocorallia herbida]